MSYLTQKTIKNNVTFSGVALHSGLNVNVCIKPAEDNFGIVFKRTDLKVNNIVYPSFMNVTNTSLNTTVENDFGVKVSTIEHLMGALFGLGIDNALVEIDNEEVPILDGSAKEFIEILKSCGLKKSKAPIKIIKVQKKIRYHHGEKFISIEPSKLSLDINFKLKFEDCLIGNQENKINVYEDDLVDIFNSRTFCLFDDVQKKYKETHVKVFNTGKLELPGIKCKHFYKTVLSYLTKMFNEHCNISYTVCDKHETVLINSNFSCGYCINREKMARLLQEKYLFETAYDPCSYPGIMSKWVIPNTNNRISFMIFRTGSVLIVGKCCEEDIFNLYSILKTIFNDEFNEINVNDNIISKPRNEVKTKYRRKYIDVTIQ